MLTDKLEEIFEIRSSPVLGRGHWTKVHFASEGLSIPANFLIIIQEKIKFSSYFFSGFLLAFSQNSRRALQNYSRLSQLIS